MHEENSDGLQNAFQRGLAAANHLRRIDMLAIFGFGLLCGVAATVLLTWIWRH
jgi:hypothetical protein